MCSTAVLQPLPNLSLQMILELEFDFEPPSSLNPHLSPFQVELLSVLFLLFFLFADGKKDREKKLWLSNKAETNSSRAIYEEFLLKSISYLFFCACHTFMAHSIGLLSLSLTHTHNYTRTHTRTHTLTHSLFIPLSLIPRCLISEDFSFSLEKKNLFCVSCKQPLILALLQLIKNGNQLIQIKLKTYKN